MNERKCDGEGAMQKLNEGETLVKVVSLVMPGECPSCKSTPVITGWYVDMKDNARMPIDPEIIEENQRRNPYGETKRYWERTTENRRLGPFAKSTAESLFTSLILQGYEPEKQSR